ncbi:hypothetical protein YC2023_001802 [Brassica napus]
MSDHETPMVNGVVEHKIGEEVLPFVEDEYGGVIVEMTTPTDPKCFVATLRYSFTQWRSQRRERPRGVALRGRSERGVRCERPLGVALGKSLWGVLWSDLMTSLRNLAPMLCSSNDHLFHVL